jgi:hypothetical protein
MCGGGGYGGVGGCGSYQWNDAGTNYGDSVITDLYGGSGGAGCFRCAGGGGAVEFIALGMLTVGGTIDVHGHHQYEGRRCVGYRRQ